MAKTTLRALAKTKKSLVLRQLTEAQSKRRSEHIAAITEFRKSFDKYLLKLSGVRSIYTGFKFRKNKITREIAIVVGVEKKKPSEALHPSQVIPRELTIETRGRKRRVVTDVIEVGIPRLTGRLDGALPALGGDSVGVVDQSGEGTLGIAVTDNASGRQGFVTASHVLTLGFVSSNVVIKPGAASGGTISNRIGVFDASRCSPISWGGQTVDIDAGLVHVDSIGSLSPNIEGLGARLTWTNSFADLDPSANFGAVVAKSGRTTGLTFGLYLGNTGTYSVPEITLTNQEVIVNVDAAGNLLSSSLFQQPGDSGALLVWDPNDDGDLVGAGLCTVVDAGSTGAGTWSRIAKVLNVGPSTLPGAGGTTDNTCFFVTALSAPTDKLLLKFLYSEREKIRHSDFGKEILDLYDSLRETQLVSALLQVGPMMGVALRALGVGRQLYKEPKRRFTEKDYELLMKLVTMAEGFVSSARHKSVLTRVKLFLRKSIGKTGRAIIAELY